MSYDDDPFWEQLAERLERIKRENARPMPLPPPDAPPPPKPLTEPTDREEEP
jgi:hypothetical protein